jgi:hypothetical protein
VPIRRRGGVAGGAETIFPSARMRKELGQSIRFRGIVKRTARGKRSTGKGRAQLHDLGNAVSRLPNLSDGPTAEAMKATGTDGRFVRRFAQPDARICGGMAADDGNSEVEGENSIGPNPLPMLGVVADLENMTPHEGSSPSRTRTYNKPVNSRLLYRLSYRGIRRQSAVSTPIF